MKIHICSLIFFILFILFILNLILYLFYKKQIIIKNILHAWKQKVNDGNITFDGIGNYKNDYYLSLDKDNDWSTHIHLFTDNKNCYLCYVAKKNNKYSSLYIIDTNKDASLIVDEMLSNFNKT